MKYLTYLSFFLSSVSSVFATTPHAYVCNQRSNSVTIIDVTNDTTETIFGFTNPRTVHLNPEGTLAFVGSDDDTLRVIQTSTHLLLPNVVSVNHPVAMALTPNADFIYVASKDDTVNVISTSTYTIVASIPGFDNLQDIKVTPNGRFAYVTNAGNDTVSMIDISSNKIVDTITGFNKPVGLTISVDGTIAYVTETGRNSVAVIDLSTNTISDVILGFNNPAYAAASPNKDFIYVANTGDNRVNVIRTSDNFTVHEIPVPTPRSMAVSEDGNFLYVGSDAGTVNKIDLINYTIATILPGFSNPSNIAMTNNNPPGFTVNGCQNNDDPMNLMNLITWQTGPGNPTQFRIFRDAALTQFVAAIPGTVSQFTESNLVPGQSYSYYVLADHANGFSSTIGSVRVTPTRLCQ
jgi:YVTN family beta-propeller protein